MPRSIHSKPPVSAWLIRERKRAGMKPAEVAARLTALGLPVQEGTVRTWEAGRSPSPENVEGLERIFESRSPAASSDKDATVPSELVSLLRRQAEAQEATTRAIEANTDMLRQVFAVLTRQALDDPEPERAAEATDWALDRLANQPPRSQPVVER